MPIPAHAVGQMRKGPRDDSYLRRNRHDRLRQDPRSRSGRRARVQGRRPPPAAGPRVRFRRGLVSARSCLRLRHRSPHGHRERATQHLALQEAAAGALPGGGDSQLGAGLYEADQRRPARQGPRRQQDLDQGRHRQPDALIQGPGGRRSAGRCPRVWLHRPRLPLHRQPGQCRCRRRCPRGLGFGGADPVVAGAREGAHHRCVRRLPDRRRRQLRRRQPAGHRVGG